MPFLQSFTLKHIVPSVFDAAASLLLVFLILRIFRITNPRTRFAMYLIILLRSFLILMDNAYTKLNIAPNDYPFFIGFRLIDPLNLLTLNDASWSNIAYDNSALTAAILIAFFAVAGFIIVRWIQLLVFFHRLKSEPELDQTKYPRLYETVDAIAGKLNVKRPKLVRSNRFPMVPFAVGFRKPAIVLSRELINEFSHEQLEIMLAHEMAHIKRGDYTNGWLLLILRDIMFFNPLAHFIYRKAEEEKEKICDREILHTINTTPKKIALLLVDVAIFYKTEKPQTARTIPSMSKGFLFKESALEKRVTSIMNSPEKSDRHRFLLPRTILKAIMCLFLLLFQLIFMINIGGTWLILR